MLYYLQAVHFLKNDSKYKERKIDGKSDKKREK